MFKITGTQMEMTRGDAVSFKFKINDYTFQEDDKVEFRVYEKKGLEKDPVLSKSVVATEESEYLLIELTSEETKIGEMLNKATTYWYEIEFNDSQTIIGYDETGAKELILYPEGEE